VDVHRRAPLLSFDLRLPGRVVFGAGAFDRLGELARDLGMRRALVVADPGMRTLGLVDRAGAALAGAGVASAAFHGFAANPDTRMVEAGRVFAAGVGVDGIVAVGGGSSLDCAKGINFVLTNGGTIRAYRGFGKATEPMLPMIGVPTTAGTGSDAQSYAIISDAETHAKMACGDPKAMFRTVILDPDLTVSQSAELTATTGIDAISHAVESFVTTRRSAASDLFAREAWRLLSAHFARVLEGPHDRDARAAMLLGSHYAGAAVEHSMLGASHACANPLTARYGTTHGVAIAVMLPHVVRWNAEVAGDRYGELCDLAGWPAGQAPGAELASRLGGWIRSGGLPESLAALEVPAADLPALADDAATQWTGTFNPRPFDRSAALELYGLAMWA
jgi:alcohol dehydrogenase